MALLNNLLEFLIHEFFKDHVIFFICEINKTNKAFLPSNIIFIFGKYYFFTSYRSQNEMINAKS